MFVKLCFYLGERLQGNKKEDLAAAVSAPAVSATGDDDEDS